MMTRIRQGLLFGMVLVAATAWADPAPFVPEEITQQGRLLDPSDQPVNGAVEMTFSLFNQATGGSSFWSEDTNVQVENGYYAVVLGDTSVQGVKPITSDLLTPPVYLEVSVDQHAMSPRLQLGSVPYAMLADRANSIDGGTITNATITGSSVDATSVSIGGHPVIDSNGNLVNLAQQLQGAGMVASDSSELGGKPASDYVTTGDLTQNYATASDLASQQYDNMLVNGSFEIAAAAQVPVAAWVSSTTVQGTSGSFTQSTTAKFGAKALDIADKDPNVEVAVKQVAIAAGDIAGYVGDTFTASVYANRVNGTTQGRICIIEADGSGAGAMDCTPLTTDNQYERAVVSHVVTSSAQYLTVLLDTGSVINDENEYLFDGAMLTEGNLAPAFAGNVSEEIPAGSIGSSKLIMGPGSGLNADLLDGMDSSAFVQLASTQTITGTKMFSAAPAFTGSGAPFTVTSGTEVTNLNAAMLGGMDSNAFVQLANTQTITGTKTFSAAPAFTGSGAPFTVTSGTEVTNLNADKLDGLQGTQFMRADADTSTTGNLNVGGNITMGGTTLTIHGGQALTEAQPGGAAGPELLLNGGGTFTGGIWATGTLHTNGDVVVRGNITASQNIGAVGNMHASGIVSASADVTAGGNVSATGNITAGGKIGIGVHTIEASVPGLPKGTSPGACYLNGAFFADCYCPSGEVAISGGGYGTGNTTILYESRALVTNGVPVGWRTTCTQMSCPSGFINTCYLMPAPCAYAQVTCVSHAN